MKLTEMDCVPDRSIKNGLETIEIGDLHKQIPDWLILEENGVKRLQRAFSFKNFNQALAFTNRIGEIAEKQNHHPAVTTEWGKVTVVWWTHTVKGLHLNDFIMAAKTDEIERPQ